MKKKLIKGISLDREKVRKIWMTMRLIVFLFFVSLIHVSASVYSQKTRLNINLENASLQEVFQTIQEQSEFDFFYKNEQIPSEARVSMQCKDEAINIILDKVLTGTGLRYHVLDKDIVISVNAVEKNQISSQQQKSVSGKVTDHTGASLPGVSVVVKGTIIGTITDNNGTYSISSIPEDATLQFSFIGMKSQEVFVGKKSNINLAMEEETYGIDEVVAIGYGTVKKSDLTGSVSSILSKDLGDRQVSDIGSLIQGKVPGVDVSQGKIRIRGVTTFNKSDPLYVIDGFLGGNLETVNANDIESIEVLKDASATAIYGSKGANGVILVTTKGGKVGPLRVSVNAYTGIATTPKKLDVLNASQYIDYMKDLAENAGQTINPALLDPALREDVTIWQDETFRTARNSELSVDFSGGSDKATYFLSVGHKYNEFITIGPQNTTSYIRNKNDFNISKWFRVGNNFAFNYNTSKGERPYIAWPIQMPQYFAIYDPTNLGGYSVVDRSTGADGGNPLVSNLSRPESEGLGYQTNLWAEIKPIKGLVYRIQAGVSGAWSHNTHWQDAYIVQTGAPQVNNGFSESFGYSFKPLIENTLTYAHLFGKHDISVMVGNTWQNYSHGGDNRISSQEFDNTEIKNVFFAKSKNIDRQYSWNYAYLSYFGRFNYQFDNKYLLTVNMRRDGSPRFAPQNRWGTFPSVAVAWKMHEEGFIKNLNIFDQFKLRASWGVSGNDEIGDFRFVSQVWANGVYYPSGPSSGASVPITGATVKDNSSVDIKWESTDSKNIAADMAFLKNSLTVTAEYFIKNSNDILFEVPRPASLGYGLAFGGNAVVNAASCENKGFEIQLGYKGEVKDFHYSVNANYTNVKNKVTGLGLGQPFLTGVSRTDIGHPIGYFYGFVADGIFKNQSELDAANALAIANGWGDYQEAATGVGDVRFKDLNGDGQITYDGDRTMIGNSIPQQIYGLNITLDYKGFDFIAYFQGIAGSDLYFANHQYLRGGTRNSNQLAYVLDRWRSESEPGNGIVPRAVLGDPNLNDRPSSNMVSSGDYLKLRQLSLGFTLPERLTSKAGIEKVRVYASASNVLTITKYHSYDPEVGSNNSDDKDLENLLRGIDNFDYPTPRSVVLGIQIGF